MKNNSKRLIFRAVAFALTLIMIILSVCSCATAVKDPVLEYEGYAISLSAYEFMLSRMKGTLARNKYDVTPTGEFWGEKHPGSDMTNEEYYNDSILKNCKNYLAALVLFDEEGLELSAEKLREIDEEIEFYIDYDCAGSQDKLNTLLSKYGTDVEGLREIYKMEAKYQAVITSLYGLDASQIADSVKEEYYQNNYYRFKQILVSNFYYEYETDEKGNVIYFDSSTGTPVYDAGKGEYKYDDKGDRITDKYGVGIRYDSEGNIVYDTEKGYPAPKTDERGNAIKYEYSKEKMDERVGRMNSFIASTEGDASAFEAEMSSWQLYEGAEEYYPDGYYLSDIESSGYSEYMVSILEKLKTMETGEITVVESESGYHVIMKYELDKGKYADKDYAEWFTSFNQSLIDRLFLDRCASFYSSITVNEKNLKKARSIKSLGTNFDY